MKRKEITATISVEINGECYQWDDLPEQKKREISIDINRRAMKAIGFKVKDGQKTDTN